MTAPAFMNTEGGARGGPGYRWRCTTCETVFRWSPSSIRWGTEEDVEAVFCCDECAGAWKRPPGPVRHIFPVYQVLDDGSVVPWGTR